MAVPTKLALFCLALGITGACAQISCPDLTSQEVSGLASACASASDVCGPQCVGVIFAALIEKLDGELPCEAIASNPQLLSNLAQECGSPFASAFISAGVDVQALASCDITPGQILAPVIDDVTCTDTDDPASQALASVLGSVDDEAASETSTLPESTSAALVGTTGGVGWFGHKGGVGWFGRKGGWRKGGGLLGSASKVGDGLITGGAGSATTIGGEAAELEGDEAEAEIGEADATTLG